MSSIYRAIFCWLFIVTATVAGSVEETKEPEKSGYDSSLVALLSKHPETSEVMMLLVQVKRPDGSRLWRVFGGVVGFEESFKKTAIREVYEESAASIILNPRQLKKYYEGDKKQWPGRKYRLYVVRTNYISAEKLTERLKKLKSQKATAKKTDDAAGVGRLKHYKQNMAFKWVVFQDLLEEIVVNQKRGVTVKKPDGEEQKVVVYKKDRQRLRESASLLKEAAKTLE